MVKVGINISGQQARLAGQVEDLGLDSVWAGDHLATNMPVLDVTQTLATAAAVTSTVELGMVMQIALRPAAWAAKQIGSLQTLSGNRVQLGVGVGGEWPDEWAAAGMSLAGRGRRTDDTLKALPSLLGGHATRTPDTNVVIRLTPVAPTPPVWIAGSSQRARRRAAELGDGWYPAMITPARYAEGLTEIRDLAAEAGRPAPRGGLQLFGALGTTTDALAAMLNKQYSLPFDLAGQILLGGAPAQVADRINEFVKAGADHVSVVAAGPDWRTQADLLAEVKALL
ncbi:LLM class flavin-dependent oxidoreductase [Actinocrispum wychmicini]|uniref:Alkanesulfonate monooxygenase SsuD/methylene tetrahydromethanopterin reductase-like flavin-dependent oxidoreductase (Luciferase family) n=1 Tax=Actinocrispum wychmicini TaxID=1213861 RepID=A0A4R2JZI6_9PSEU|nr:LLM class flavin-dependent oxidoreductase [Actinocrispum wychmicini]TCO64777.1 alkanesulfonate monooxygenase SsuD/methylene tetrahydromethanopterin reductase-like flavin-dependent oxidoreductase (luciferase family) [Actinocrispum wychmicini]